MSNTLMIGKRLVPIEHVALVEPFDPAARSKLQTDRVFQTRVVLVDRESLLTEEAPDAFADKHGFRALSEDGIATNPAVHFGVEGFEPAEGFKPSKPYQCRLLWRDQEGRVQSKLLLASPERVLAAVVRGEVALPAATNPPEVSVRGGRGRKSSPSPA